MPLPSGDLRSNLGTWAVPADRVPAVAAALLGALPREAFDPAFAGQRLATTYFDTPRLRLRRARRKGDRYLTLRVRSYQPQDGPQAWALSAKTESGKFREEITAEDALALLDAPDAGPLLAVRLPADLAARLVEMAEGPLVPAARVSCQRYAVEDDRDRLTLDVDVRTRAGKALPFGVLEFKSTQGDAVPPSLGLPPLKLSKFLWATEA